MDNAFTAHNELEKKLVDLLSDNMDHNVFMKELLDEQLFMPVEDEKAEIAGFQKNTKANPLTLEAEGGIKALILFTSPERAKEFLQDFPDYTGGLLSEFTWILDRLGSDIAVSINPGLEVGLDLDPLMVEQLIHLNNAKKS